MAKRSNKPAAKPAGKKTAPQESAPAAGEPDLSYIAAALQQHAVAIALLTPDPRNARTHDNRNIASIKYSLKTFKQQLLIVVDADGVILAGNGTVRAAKELGWTHIAVNRCEFTGAKARAFAIAVNRSGELATWDAQELSDQLEEISDAEIDVSIEGLQFSDDELSNLLKVVAGETEKTDAIGRPVRTEAKEPAGDKAQKWGINIKLRDEEHQARVIDAIERKDGNAMMRELEGLAFGDEIRTPVPLD